MSEKIIFLQNGQHFSIESINVEEVLEPTKITLIPHADPTIEGLINIHGKIVILFNFAKIINVNDRNSDKENIILIKNNNFLYGLLIGKIIEKIDIEDDKIIKTHKKEIPFYGGQFIFNDTTIVLIDILQAIQKIETVKDVNIGFSLSLGHTSTLGDTLNPVINQHKNDLYYLIAKINEEIFGINIQKIQELILIKDITSTQFLSKKVLGIINLRNMPLLVLSLPHIIHDKSDNDLYKYGIVIKTEKGTLILAIHDLLKIERFEKSDYHLFNNKDSEIKGWLKGSDKKFFPTVDIETLLLNPLFKDLENYINDISEENMEKNPYENKRYLVTKIEDEYCAISLNEVKIVVDEISLQELPVADSKTISQNYLMGIANVHGEIIYVIDTYSLLNKEKIPFKNYVVIHSSKRTFALSINNVDMVLSIDESQIENLANNNEIIKKIAKVDKKLISLIDTNEIVHLLPQLGS